MKNLQHIIFSISQACSQASVQSRIFITGIIVSLFMLSSCTIFGFKAGVVNIKNDYTQEKSLQFILSRTDNRNFSSGNNTITFNLPSGTSKSVTIDWWSLDPQSIGSIQIIVKSKDNDTMETKNKNDVTIQVKSAQAREIIQDGKKYTLTMKDTIYKGSFIHDILQ